MKNIKDYVGKKYGVLCETEEQWQKILELVPVGDRHADGNRFNQSRAKVMDLERVGCYWGGCSIDNIIKDYGYTILNADDFLEHKKVEDITKEVFNILKTIV